MDVEKTLNELDLNTHSRWTFPAGLFSWITCPLLCPVYGILLILHLSVMKHLPVETKSWLVTTIFGLNVIMPIGLIFLLKAFKLINDVALNRQKERKLPYLITISCLFASAFVLYKWKAPMWVATFFVGGGAAGIVNLIVNRWWKISAHSAGIAGLIAMLFCLPSVGMPQSDVTPWLIGMIISAGLLGTCRVFLRRHTFGQVMMGYLVGFFGVYLSITCI